MEREEDSRERERGRERRCEGEVSLFTQQLQQRIASPLPRVKAREACARAVRLSGVIFGKHCCCCLTCACVRVRVCVAERGESDGGRAEPERLDIKVDSFEAFACVCTCARAHACPHFLRRDDSLKSNKTNKRVRGALNRRHLIRSHLSLSRFPLF